MLLLFNSTLFFQISRQELEKQQLELKDMLDKLEADRNMELSERLKLEEEIAAKQVSRFFYVRPSYFAICSRLHYL